MPADTASEKPIYEKDKAAELARQELERRQFMEGFAMGRSDFLDSANKQHMDPIEIEEKLKAMEERKEKRYQALLAEQRHRTDLLELRHLGPPSDRER
jgi:hypothetical protein